LNQARAHVHLELNLMLSRRFESWHATFPNEPNRHDLYNGLNLWESTSPALSRASETAGADDPGISGEEETAFIARVGAGVEKKLRPREVLSVDGQGKIGGTTGSWEVSFNRAGVPLKIQPGRNGLGTGVST